MFAAFSEDGLGSWVSAYRKADRIDEAITKYAYTDYTFSDAARIEADEQTTQRVATLIFKLLVVLNTRPALVEPGGIERAEKRHPKTGKITRSELWLANLIGAKYRVLHSPRIGTHASPKAIGEKAISPIGRSDRPRRMTSLPSAHFQDARMARLTGSQCRRKREMPSGDPTSGPGPSQPWLNPARALGTLVASTGSRQ